MILRHPILAQSVVAALIVAAAALWLTYSVPAHAGETCGLASWYSTESGTRTATGEHFDGTSMTAAMPDRKRLGERYRVTHGSKSVVVRINDVGPAKRLHRVIDLSKAAAAKLGLIARGVGPVCLERL